MREKGWARKTRKILIRVNRDEKKLAEELSHKKGKNTSEYFRDLLHEDSERKHLDIHVKIAEKYEKTLGEFRTLLNTTIKKRRG
jgi:serine phosphatase RsbU (regulator of sigma subunit)